MKRVPINLDWKLSIGSRWFSRETKTVDLPNDYISTMPRKADNPGAGSVGFFASEDAEYSRTVTLPENFDGTLLLNMDGAYEKAEVYVGRDLVFRHPYGYTGTICDLTKFVKPGENTLSISLSCRHPASRWYTGGGLFREVCLYEAGKVYIHPWNVFITTPVVEKDFAVVRFDCTVTNSAAYTKGTLTAWLEDAGGHRAAELESPIRLNSGDNQKCLELPVREPALWNIDAPNLYKAFVKVSYGDGEDTWEGRVGIRRIEMDAKNGLRVNGVPMKIRGGCIHHDNAFLGAAAFPRAEERKVESMKKAGFTGIRTAHNPPSTALLDACDRLGMLVLVESFDCWRVRKSVMDYHQSFEEWWDYDTSCMVRRDRNHPSVYCWSIGNEIMEFDGVSEGVKWGKLQADLVRSLDPTRPVTSGINMACGRPQDYYKNMSYQESAYDMAHCTGIYDGEDRWGDATEPNIENLDVCGYNYTCERYAIDAVKYPDRVIQGTETMPYYVWENYTAVRDNPNCIGDFVWVAVDNMGEAGMGNVYYAAEPPKGMMHEGWPWMSCYQGDLDLTCRRRPINYYRTAVWDLEHDIHIFAKHPKNTGLKCYGTGWHWEDVDAHWKFEDEWIGKPAEISAYVDAATEKVEFYVNGKLEASVIPERCQALALVPYYPGTVEAAAYKNGAESSRDRLVTSGAAAKLRLQADRCEIRADGMDLSFIRATLTDESGVPVLFDDRDIFVTVEGDAVLQGLGSGRPKTPEDYGTGHRLSFKGEVCGAVRAGRTPGTVKVTFRTDGIPEAVICIRMC